MRRWGTAVFFILLTVSAYQPIRYVNQLRQPEQLHPPLSYDDPPPQAGKSHMAGHILWNDAGIAAIDLMLCEALTPSGGCNGRSYTTTTRHDGTFLFADIEPGAYALAAYPGRNDQWIYLSADPRGYTKFETLPNQLLAIEPQPIHYFDLLPFSPPHQYKSDIKHLSLSWQDYAQAHQYRVTVAIADSQIALIEETTTATELQIELPAMNCRYDWSVTAVNEAGTVLAVMPAPQLITLIAQESACELQTVAPTRDAVAHESVALAWLPHPLAATYLVTLWNEDKPEMENILSQAPTAATEYVFATGLEAGHYLWSVTAVGKNGRNLATSAPASLTVLRSADTN